MPGNPVQPGPTTERERHSGHDRREANFLPSRRSGEDAAIPEASQAGEGSAMTIGLGREFEPARAVCDTTGAGPSYPLHRDSASNVTKACAFLCDGEWRSHQLLCILLQTIHSIVTSKRNAEKHLQLGAERDKTNIPATTTNAKFPIQQIHLFLRS